MNKQIQPPALDEINLLDYWRVIVKWKRMIGRMVAAITLLTIVISLFMTKIYKAEATIMPVGGKASGFSMAAAQMGLGGLLGGGGTTASTQLMAVLQSRTLAEKMIEQHDLIKVFYPKISKDPKKRPKMEDVVRQLQAVVTFTDDKKSQLIRISAEFKDPQIVATLVNAYIEEATRFLNENALTTAKRNRIFIEDQLERNKAELLEGGKELADFYAVNKISNIVPTVDVDVSMEKPSTPPTTVVEEDPVTPPEQKAEELKEKIKQAKVVKDVPQQIYLQYLSLRRELLGQVNSLLTQQYEMAKIEETKEDLNFQVIDWARVPEGRFKPRRRQMVMTGFVMGFLGAILLAFFMEYLEKMKSA